MHTAVNIVVVQKVTFRSCQRFAGLLIYPGRRLTHSSSPEICALMSLVHNLVENWVFDELIDGFAVWAKHELILGERIHGVEAQVGRGIRAQAKLGEIKEGKWLLEEHWGWKGLEFGIVQRQLSALFELQLAKVLKPSFLSLREAVFIAVEAIYVFEVLRRLLW